MYEYILSAFLSDKTKAFFIVEPLYGSGNLFCHKILVLTCCLLLPTGMAGIENAFWQESEFQAQESGPILAEGERRFQYSFSGAPSPVKGRAGVG